MAKEKRTTPPRVWQDIAPRPASKPTPKKMHIHAPRIAVIQSFFKRIKRASRRKKLVTILFITTGLTVLLFGIMYLTNKNDKSTPTTIGKMFTTADLPRGTPEYDTVLPTGKTINDYGGWTRVSPTTADPVYAYVDTVASSPIRVSQQPLPKGFDEDTAQQVSSLAQDLGANQVLNVGETIVYIGTSSKGPQSLVFTKNNLLILIRSTVVVPNADWAAYISSLN